MEFYRQISSKLLIKFNRLSKSSAGRYGIPFAIFLLAGSYGLKEFTSIRYQYRDSRPVVYEEAKKAGIEMKKPGEVTLETVYDTVKDIDIDHWENKRGPRPWEENTNS